MVGHRHVRPVQAFELLAAEHGDVAMRQMKGLRMPSLGDEPRTGMTGEV